MATEGADNDRTGGTDGTRAAARSQESAAHQGPETDRQGSGVSGTARATDFRGSIGPEVADPKTAAAVAAAEAAGPSNGESVRIDSWIWSVRLVKTRSLGATACRGGHVQVNGERVKPAHSVRVGDEVRLRHEGRERVVIVKRLIRKRVGAPVAAVCYIDNSPPPPPREAFSPLGIRDRGTGRPTKRDRRELERLRGLGGVGGMGGAGGAGTGGTGSVGRPSGGRPGGR